MRSFFPAQAQTSARSWVRYLLVTVLLASLVVCLHGIGRSTMFGADLWLEPRATATVAFAVLAAVLLIERMARRMRVSDSLAFAVACTVVAAAFAGLGATLAALLQLLSAFCIGRRIYPAGNGPDPGAPFGVVVVVATGLAVLSIIVGVLSFLPLNSPATYLGMLGLPIAMGFRGNVEHVRGVIASWKRRRPLLHTSTRILHLVIGVALSVRLLAVLQPELGADALAMHLVVADVMAQEGRFHYDVTRSIWALMPLASDWQFAIANMLGGEHAARLMNFAAEALIVAGIYQATTRERTQWAGAFAAVAYVTTPLMYLETSSLFAENFWALWVMAALLAARDSVGRDGYRSPMVGALLLGVALSAKVISVFLAPFFLVTAVAWFRRYGSREGAWRVAVFLLVVALVAAPTYANAWLRSGNPVFPFMNDVFKSPLFQPVAFDNALFPPSLSWRTLYDVTFESGRFLEALPGAFGLAFLVLLPAAFAHAVLSSATLRTVALCALGFAAAVFSFQSYLRYVLPMLPLFAMLIGVMSEDILPTSRVGRALMTSLGIACGAAGMYLAPTATNHYRAIALPAFAGTEAEERYIQRERPERAMARVIDSMQLKRVLWLGSPYIAGADTDVRVVNWHGGHEYVRAFDALASGEEMRVFLSRNKIDGVAIASDFEPCRRKFLCDFIRSNMHKVFGVGTVGLYTPDAALLFSRELLANPGFDQPGKGWSGAEQAWNSGAVLVSAASPYSQAVAVSAGQEYFLEIEARCEANEGAFRNQVNWLDASGAFLETHIDVLPCTQEYVAHHVVVEAPKGAVTAMVYASGHAPETAVQVTRVSFRQ